jgi:aminopeptidase N
MSNVEDFERAKKRIDRLRTERDQAAGRLESNLERLKADFDVDSIEEAESLLEQEQDKLDELEKKLDKQVEKLKNALPN